MKKYVHIVFLTSTLTVWGIVSSTSQIPIRTSAEAGVVKDEIRTVIGYIDEIEALNLEVIRRKKANLEYEKQIRRLKYLNRELQSKYDISQNTVASLNATIVALNDRIRNLQMDSIRYRDELRRTRKERDSIGEEKRDLEILFEQFKDEARQRIKDFQAQIDELNKMYEKHRNESLQRTNRIYFGDVNPCIGDRPVKITDKINLELYYFPLPNEPIPDEVRADIFLKHSGQSTGPNAGAWSAILRRTPNSDKNYLNYQFSGPFSTDNLKNIKRGKNERYYYEIKINGIEVYRSKSFEFKR